jgi:hypothetical protein
MTALRVGGVGRQEGCSVAMKAGERACRGSGQEGCSGGQESGPVIGEDPGKGQQEGSGAPEENVRLVLPVIRGLFRTP